MRNRHVRLAVLAALSSASALAGFNATAGDIAFDGSLPGTQAGTLDAVNGTYNIGQNQGFLNGSNLFHSFDVFNLDVDETAIFSGNAAIANIISRVTGGIPTTIDGTIRSTINGANFWFVNPAGLTVGATGAIDVSGAVALGAADYIDFANGARFMALLDGEDVGVSLSMSAPVDFGFLEGSFAGELRIESSDLLSRTANASPRQIQPLAGGERFSMLLSGGSGVFLETDADIELHAARIRTGSDFVAGNIEIHAGGSINLSNSDLLTNAPVEGFGGGDIFIQGGELVSLSSSSVVAQSIDAQASTGSITITGAGVLINDYSQVSLDFRASDGGIEGIGVGNISIGATGSSDEIAPEANLTTATAGVVRIVDSTISASSAGSRTIDPDDFIPEDAISIGGKSFDPEDPDFDPDDPDFDPDSLFGTAHVVIAGATISTDATDGGFAANTRISADAGIWILDSNNRSSTLTARASDTALSAGSISVSGGSAGVTVENATFDTFNSAPGSDDNLTFSGISVEADGDVRVVNSTLRADADNGFGAGSVGISGSNVYVKDSTLTASTTVRDPNRPTILNNAGGSIGLGAGPFEDEEIFFPGQGTVLDTGSLTIENSTLRANSSNNGSPTSDPIGANAGSIQAFASNLLVSNSTLETAATGGNSGAAGLIRLSADNIEVANSTLNVSTETLNMDVVNAGDDELQAIEFDTLGGGINTGSLKLTNSTVTVSTSGVAAGGSIFAIANDIEIQGSNIQASTTGTGSAGAIVLLAFGIDFSQIPDEPEDPDDPDLPEDPDMPGDGPLPSPMLGPPFVRITDSTLATSTGSTPSIAGSILIISDGQVDVTRSSLNVSATATLNASAPGGAIDPRIPIDIDIDPSSVGNIQLFAGSEAINIVDSTLQANTSGLVNGGSIDLEGGSFLARNSSITASSSAANPNGVITDPVLGPLDPDASAGAISIGGGDAFTLENSTVATNAAATNGGDIELGGFNFVLRDSKILASAGGAGIGGDIFIGAGTLSLQNSQVQSSAETGVGGNIQILSGATTLRDSSIATDATAGNGGDILLDTAGEVLSLQNSSVVASAGGAGTGGDITLATLGAGTSLQNSQIQALANTGNGGTISLGLVDAVGSTLQILDSQVAANAAAANGGDVTIDTAGAQLVMTRSSLVASAGGNGVGGDISIVNVAGVTLTDSQVQALADAGSGGTITIDLRETASSPVSLDNSSIRTNALNSNGGSITIDASGQRVSLQNSDIVASAGGTGTGGGISISNAAGTSLQGSRIQALAAAGTGGTISISQAAGAGGAVTLDNSSIMTNATAANGGNIAVDAAGNAVTLNNSMIVASAGGTGVGGGISISNAGATTLTGSQVQALANMGTGGTINIALASGQNGALVLDNSSIRTNAVAANGGNITLDAAGNQVVLRGATIVASAGGNGTGGDISILSAGGATLQNTQIQALADAGAGGTISIDVLEGTGPVVIQRSNITTNAVTAGGGNITLDAGGNSVLLRDSTIVASAGAAGTGGNILIDNLGRTIMQRSQILARADAGNGGTITLNLTKGALFLRDAQSTISADSNSGNDGQVAINSPDTDVNPAVKLQDAALGETPELSANGCTPAIDAARSTFVRDSRGGVTPSPDNYLVSIQGTAAPQASAAAPLARPAAEEGGLRVAMVAAEASTPGCN
jgi:filamentous hemagglutinin family protein